jgi:hypothetical protein
VLSKATYLARLLSGFKHTRKTSIVTADHNTVTHLPPLVSHIYTMYIYIMLTLNTFGLPCAMPTCDEVLINLHLFSTGSLKDMSFAIRHFCIQKTVFSSQRMKDTVFRLDALIKSKTPTSTERKTSGPASTESLYWLKYLRPSKVDSLQSDNILESHKISCLFYNQKVNLCVHKDRSLSYILNPKCNLTSYFIILILLPLHQNHKHWHLRCGIQFH